MNKVKNIFLWAVSIFMLFMVLGTLTIFPANIFFLISAIVSNPIILRKLNIRKKISIPVCIVAFFIGVATFPHQVNSNVKGQAIKTDGTEKVSTESILHESKSKDKLVESEKISHKNGINTTENEDGVYVGNFVNDVFNGNGIFTYKNSESYEGTYVNGVRKGQGTFKWLDGSSYVGSWDKDDINGDGVFKSAKEDVLQGTFKNGVLVNGQYIATRDKNSITFDIVDSKLTNKCVMTFENGTSYDGTIKDKVFEGPIEIKYANGDKYNGEVEKNLKSGTGTYTWKNGAKYVGIWKNDKMEGKGIYYYTSSETQRIEATFLDNKPTSKAIYYDASGVSYITYWSNGKCTKVEIKGE